MGKIIGVLFTLVLAMSLMLMPSPVSAGIGDACTYDTVKWEDNEISWGMYLQHWGRTPLSAMSRLAGLCGPDALCPEVCNASGLCPGTRITGCDIPTCGGGCCCSGSQSIGCCVDDEVCESCLERVPGGCCCCWGISLCFANKSWAGSDISAHPRVNNEHPNHFGNSTGGSGNSGGDWGISGCLHTECVAGTWCLADNLGVE